MAESLIREHAPARRAPDQPLLDQEGLDHLLDRVALLGKRRRQSVDPDRTAAIACRDAVEITPVHQVETETVDLELGEPAVGLDRIDLAGPGDGSEIAQAAQEATGDPRRAARPGGRSPPLRSR